MSPRSLQAQGISQSNPHGYRSRKDYEGRNGDSQRNIESALRAKQVVFEMLDVSGTEVETRSVAIDAEMLKC